MVLSVRDRLLGARPVRSARRVNESGCSSRITRRRARLSSDSTSASERMDVNQILGSPVAGRCSPRAMARARARMSSCEAILQQLIGAGEFIGHALVTVVAMFVIVDESATRVTPTLGWLHRVCIVVPEQPGSVAVMQRQCVANAMRNMLVGLHLSCFDLDPVTVTLVVNLAIQQQQRFDARVLFRHYLITC